MSLAPNLKLFLAEAGDISRFRGSFFRQWFKPRYEIAEFVISEFFSFLITRRRRSFTQLRFYR